MGQWSQEKAGTGAKVRGMLIGATVPMGQGELRASYADFDVKGTAGSGASAIYANPNDWSKMAIGYGYNLSKRTQMYATYARVSNDGTQNTVPAIFHQYPSQEHLYALFIHNASLYRRDLSSTISLNDPIRYQETKRQLVAKSITAGINVSESEDYTSYWNILNEALKKLETTAVHSLEEIKLLHSRFPEKIKLFAAFDNCYDCWYYCI